MGIGKRTGSRVMRTIPPEVSNFLRRKRDIVVEPRQNQNPKLRRSGMFRDDVAPAELEIVRGRVGYRDVAPTALACSRVVRGNSRNSRPVFQCNHATSLTPALSRCGRG